MKKTILMLLNKNFLPDIRVEQECEALTEVGYRVIVVANHEGTNDEAYEIIRINPNEKQSQLYNLTLKKNPKLENEIIKGLSNKGVKEIAAIHVHDLFWSFLGVQLKKKYNSKLVIDLHENYPAFIADINGVPSQRTINQYLKIGLRSLRKPKKGYIKHVIAENAMSLKRLKKYELDMLETCDRFIVVVDEALERFKNNSFYNKGVVVSNTKNPDLWHFENLRPINDKLIITYMGTIQDLRGLDTAILAMNYVDQDKFILNIVGIKRGDLMHRKFLTIIEENAIKNVNLIEWLTDEQKAFSYINKSHVCIVPHKSTELTQTTIPHKLFMYMAVGRPVLVSDVTPLKRIVENSNNGLIFKAEDPVDLAAKMSEMFNDEKLKNFSLHGRIAVENNLNWEHDKNRLLKMYDELLK